MIWRLKGLKSWFIKFFFDSRSFVRTFELCFESLSCFKRKFCPIMQQSERLARLCSSEWHISFRVMPFISTQSPTISPLKHPQTHYSTITMLTRWHNENFYSFVRKGFFWKKPFFVYFHIWNHQSFVPFPNLLKSNPFAVAPLKSFQIIFLF